MVNRSLPTHWLRRRVEESDCADSALESNCWESAVVSLTCAAALSLTDWHRALYVWKWAIITIICVLSLVFYNGVIIVFSLHDVFHPPSSSPQLSFLDLFPSVSPSTLTHPDDKNRCAINYALTYISSALHFLSTLSPEACHAQPPLSPNSTTRL